MPFTSIDEALLKKAEFFAVYPDPYRGPLVAIGKGVYQRLLKPSGAVPNLALFEMHVEVALHGANIIDKLVTDILQRSGSKNLPGSKDPWWNTVASAIARFLVWKDWSDISS